MGEFYYRPPDELYHYGVKGMKWGVRHDPVRTGRQSSGGAKKKMSTAKKVAIGVGVAAAVAGVTYAAVKTGKARQLKKGKDAVKMSRVVINQKKLTGYSKRLTKHGANAYQERFYSNKYSNAAKAGRFNDVGKYGKARQEAQKRLTSDFYSGKTKVYTTRSIKKLNRKSFAPESFRPKIAGVDHIEPNGQRVRVYGNRKYKVRR